MDALTPYANLDARLADLADRLSSSDAYERDFLLPDEATCQAIESEAAAFSVQLQALPPAGSLGDFLAGHFQDFLDGLSQDLEDFRKRPAGLLRRFLGSFTDRIRYDRRPSEERAELHLHHLSQAPRAWQVVSSRLSTYDALALRDLNAALGAYQKTMPTYLARLEKDFAGLDPAGLTELRKGIQASLAMMAEWQSSLQPQLSPVARNEDPQRRLPIPEEEYRRLLERNFGVRLEAIQSWHVEEVEKTRGALLSLATGLNGGRQVSRVSEAYALLLKNAGPYDNAAEMFARQRAYLERARSFTRSILPLPADETCVVEDIPENLRASWPWGGYGGFDRHYRPIQGYMFLNSTNVSAITDGWLKMMALHEAYPGHHCQMVRAETDPLPKTFRIGAKGTPLLEGTAHRSEKVYEGLFEEDPWFPLFVAYRRHHTSVRVKADLWFRHQGRPMNEVARLYEEELDYDPKTAFGQVLQQEEMTGYFTCYYYGVRQLLAWEHDAGLSKDEFTRKLFNVGHISLDSFQRYLQLAPEDQIRFESGVFAACGKA